MSHDTDSTPLADLCAPLSAKVMPRSAMAGRGSRVGSERQQLHAQRITRRHTTNSKQVTAKGGHDVRTR
jgi:hypothetical protein